MEITSGLRSKKLTILISLATSESTNSISFTSGTSFACRPGVHGGFGWNIDIVRQQSVLPNSLCPGK